VHVPLQLRTGGLCPHVEQWPKAALDEAVLASIAGDTLKPDLVEEVEEVVTAARKLFEASARPNDRDRRRRVLEMGWGASVGSAPEKVAVCLHSEEQSHPASCFLGPHDQMTAKK
jgi:hypothetical protein